jgi:ABC-type oligopeptide transport system ATPase subunit
LSDYFFEKDRTDSIFVIDASKEQKKYLYEILSKVGIDKQLLYRKSTTFKPRK